MYPFSSESFGECGEDKNYIHSRNQSIVISNNHLRKFTSFLSVLCVPLCNFMGWWSQDSKQRSFQGTQLFPSLSNGRQKTSQQRKQKKSGTLTGSTAQAGGTQGERHACYTEGRGAATDHWICGWQVTGDSIAVYSGSLEKGEPEDTGQFHPSLNLGMGGGYG